MVSLRVLSNERTLVNDHHVSKQSSHMKRGPDKAHPRTESLSIFAIAVVCQNTRILCTADAHYLHLDHGQHEEKAKKINQHNSHGDDSTPATLQSTSSACYPDKESSSLSLSLSLFDARLPARRRGAADAWSRAAHDRPALDGSLFAGFFPAQSP